MKNIYLFVFLVMWIFAACSSTNNNVKSETSKKEILRDVKSMEGTKEVFYDKSSGISITIPEGWKKFTPKMLIETRQSVKLSNKDLEKIIKESPNLPLVTFTRYPEPYPTLNPGVTVSKKYIPVEGIPPKDILQINAEVFKLEYPDSAYVDEIQDTNVDGNSSAYTKINFTKVDGDRKFPITTRLWLIPRGKFMIFISMSGPQEGPDTSEDAFKEIFESIKFDALSM